MKRIRLATLPAAISVGIATAATLFLIFWPHSYSGVSVDSSGSETKTGASFLSVNGYRALVVLVFPLAISVIGFLTVKNADTRRTFGKMAVWLPAVVLSLFCVVAMFSIGMFYFLPAVALIIAAALAMRQPRKAGPANPQDPAQSSARTA